MDKNQQSRLKLLIEKGKEQGFLTYAEVNDHLPEDIVDPQQIEDIIGMINDMGILVHEVAPDSDSLLLASTKNSADEDAAEEAERVGNETSQVGAARRKLGNEAERGGGILIGDCSDESGEGITVGEAECAGHPFG